MKDLFEQIRKQFPGIPEKDIAKFVVVRTTPLDIYSKNHPDENGYIEKEILGHRNSFLHAGSARKRLRLARDAVAQAKVPKFPCHKGCSACCRLEPCISGTEAQVLLDQITTLNLTQWDEFRSDRESYCPFLVDGSCSIYAERPLSCRIHNTIGSSDNCLDLDKNSPYHFDQSLHQYLSGYYTSEVVKAGERGFGFMVEMLKAWSKDRYVE